MNRPGARLQAFIGRTVDVVAMLRLSVDNPHSVTKFRQILAVKRRTGAEDLLETGTFKGVTASRCARHFKRVVTVEIDDALYADASHYLSRHANVEAVHGDATKVLPQLLSKSSSKSMLVFLDGHFSGGVTGSSDHPEPALLELRALSDNKSMIAGIIIDDFRMFQPNAEGPSKSELIGALELLFPEYRLTVNLDQVLVERLIADAQ